MKRTWTIIGVRDVASSFQWYQSLFGQPEVSPAHDHFGQNSEVQWTSRGGESGCHGRMRMHDRAHVRAQVLQTPRILYFP